MDFFAHQDRARRATKWLIGYFLVTVFCIVTIVYFATVACLAGANQDPEVPFLQILLGWHPRILLTVVASVVGTIALGSLYKIWELGSDGKRVAVLLGGKQVPPNTTNINERVLLNVVEEMALASGTPVPPVYLLSEEAAINAFAAGTSPQNAVIGITRGAIETLKRDELQGVIAHEFSHILNGDMRLNLRLIGLLHGIVMIAMIGYLTIRLLAELPRGMGSNDDSGKATVAILVIVGAIGITLIAVGSIGSFFANLIQAAVSRQREYLADASAVQFTRNPNGIADALKRIGGWKASSVLKSVEVRETAHMMFGSGQRSAWFATHPPLTNRIQRLDPQFRGEYPKTEAVDRTSADIRDPHSLRRQRQGLETAHVAALAGVEHFEARPQDAVEHIGQPLQEHVDHAHNLVEGFDHWLAEEVRDPVGAIAVIFGLLLAPNNSPVRSQQLKLLELKSDPRVANELRRLLSSIDDLEDEQRLPLACLALPSLDPLSEKQLSHFQSMVQGLIEVDGRRSFFEYAIQRFITRRIVRRSQHEPPRNLSMKQIVPSFVNVLSTLAHLTSGEESAAKAFQSGLKVVAADTSRLAIIPRSECTHAALDRALNQLESTKTSVCEKILEAFCVCVAFDSTATLQEMELLRVISDALGCPMPPILDVVSNAGPN